MADRITDKQLDALVARLNRLTQSPEKAYVEGKACVGNFHISHAYGGVCLVRMSNESGGVNTPLNHGHITKRELFNQLHAFIRGIEFGQEQQARIQNVMTEVTA